MLKTSDRKDGRRTLGYSAMRLRRAGDTCLSMEVHGNVLVVSEPWNIAWRRGTFSEIFVLTALLVDFAMTEAAYTVVRLLQRFSVLEKPDDEGEERTGREQQTMTLVLAITNGCRVRFAN
jgi:hypothetical protein